MEWEMRQLYRIYVIRKAKTIEQKIIGNEIVLKYRGKGTDMHNRGEIVFYVEGGVRLCEDDIRCVD